MAKKFKVKGMIKMRLSSVFNEDSSINGKVYVKEMDGTEVGLEDAIVYVNVASGKNGKTTVNTTTIAESA